MPKKIIVTTDDGMVLAKFARSSHARMFAAVVSEVDVPVIVGTTKKVIDRYVNGQAGFKKDDEK